MYVLSPVFGWQTCSGCPVEATCDGGVTEPVARAGFYQVDRVKYLTCKPPVACPGGGNGTSAAQCAAGYTGVACSQCDKVRSWREALRAYLYGLSVRQR